MRLRETAGFLATWVCFLAAVSSGSGPAHADSYAEARADVVAAYQAGEFSAMREAAQRALAARPDYPGAIFNRALAELLDGDAVTALQTLQSLVSQGIDPGVENIPEFEAVRSLPAWSRYAAATSRLDAPVGNAAVAFRLDVDDFIPEGIAVDDKGRLYLGSIRHGSIVRVSDSAETLSTAAQYSAVFGMRLDDSGGLWFASANVPEHAGPMSAAGPGTGLYRLDLESHAVRGTEMPCTGKSCLLGDLVLVDEGAILATDSLGGGVYRFDVATGEYATVLPAGSLGSPQGLVTDDSGNYLYVADYIGGLFRLDLRDLVLERVTSETPSALFGIDGLYRYGRELIAIQNGIRPHRVVALELSADGLAVEAIRTLARNLPEFDEPTLGQVAGDDFYFVANSHWNRFDREHNLPTGLEGPIVMRLSLRR